MKKSFEKFIDKCKKYSGSSVRILTFPTPKHTYGFDKKWNTELALYKFHDLILPGARDYDGYLTFKYGDYMKLPPEEERKTHPISKLKLL